MVEYIQKTLGTVADYINGRAFKPSEWETSGLPIIRIQNLTNSCASYNYSSKDLEEKYLIHKGDLLFAWSASLGAHIWTGTDAWLNQHIFKVIPKKDINQKYLYYFLKTVTADLCSKTHGSGMVHITKGPFMNTPVPVPPLSEQERIVAKIEELFSQLDAGVETLKKIKAQLAIYRQAVIDDSINSINKLGTTSQSFGTFVLRYQNGVSKRSGNGINTAVLRLADIEKQQITHNKEFRYIGLTDSERNRFLLNKGDILIIRVNGSENNVGRAIVVDKDGVYAACDHFIRCVVDHTRILPQFAQLLLDSFLSRKYIKENMVSTAGQNTISQTTMNNISVCVPDIANQERIINSVNTNLSVCDNIEQTVDASLQQADALRQSILKDAFEGRL